MKETLSLDSNCSNMFMKCLLCARECKVFTSFIKNCLVKLVKLFIDVLNSVIAVNLENMPDLSRTYLIT